MTIPRAYAELARQAEEFQALRAVNIAAGELGRARRYGWPQDRQAVLAEKLASARARLAALKTQTATS